MQITIQARKFSLTDALYNYADRRLRSTLDSHSDYIQYITMRLSDINGPRGGKDKRCQIQITLFGLTNVVIVDTETDLYLAIDKATDRAERNVIRKIERHRTLLRHSSPIVIPEEIITEEEQQLYLAEENYFSDNALTY
jgi:putative sigma-54 modulation protein